MHLVPHIPERKCAWLVLSQRFPAAKPSAGHITAGQQCPDEGEADLRPMALLCFGSNTCPLSVLMSRLHPKPPQTTDKGPSGYVEVFWSVLHKHSKSISVLEITIETGCQLSAGARIPDVSLEKMLMCLAQHTELPPSLDSWANSLSPFGHRRMEGGFPTPCSDTEDTKPFSTKANETSRLHSK